MNEIQTIQSKIFLRSDLIFPNGTSNWGGTRKLPYAFTEQGLAMLSGVFTSDIANGGLIEELQEANQQ